MTLPFRCDQWQTICLPVKCSFLHVLLNGPVTQSQKMKDDKQTTKEKEEDESEFVRE